MFEIINFRITLLHNSITKLMKLFKNILINKKRRIRLFTHIAGWTIVFFSVSFFTGKELSDKNYLVNYLLVWMVHLSIFYVNYFFFIPNMVIKKRRIPFLFLILALLVSAYFLNTYIKEGNRKKARVEQPKLQKDEHRKKPPPPRPKNNDLFDHGTAYGILVFFSLSTGVWFITRWQNNEKEKLRFELAYLKQQVNPHFLFNALNSIYSLASRNSPKTTDIILDLSDLLRYMLYDANKELIELNKEIECLKNYIELEKLRITDKTQINFDYSEVGNGYMIEPMLFFPLVENALKYGANNFEDSFIHIALKRNEKSLIFKCQNKIVNQRKKNKDDSGIGLENVKRRLNLHYPGAYSLKINEKNKVFDVELIINLKE